MHCKALKQSSWRGFCKGHLLNKVHLNCPVYFEMCEDYRVHPRPTQSDLLGVVPGICSLRHGSFLGTLTFSVNEVPSTLWALIMSLKLNSASQHPPTSTTSNMTTLSTNRMLILNTLYVLNTLILFALYVLPKESEMKACYYTATYFKERSLK